MQMAFYRHRYRIVAQTRRADASFLDAHDAFCRRPHDLPRHYYARLFLSFFLTPARETYMRHGRRF